MKDKRERVTELLRESDLSDPASAQSLLAYVYDELRDLAAQQMGRERAGHTLQPTALVHEAYLRLVYGDRVDWKSRAHFYGIAARAMRQILVDHARRKQASKRGGGWQRVTLDPEMMGDQDYTCEVLDLHDALNRLAEKDEALGKMVELRFFGGLTLDETADAMGVSRRKVAKDWSAARLWLKRELSND